MISVVMASLMVEADYICRGSSFQGPHAAPSALLMGLPFFYSESGHKTQSGKYYEDHDTDPDFRCVGEWYTPCNSAYPKSMGGSQVFLEERMAEAMIKCIVIASRNDASVSQSIGKQGKMNELPILYAVEHPQVKQLLGHCHYGSGKYQKTESPSIWMKYYLWSKSSTEH